MELEKIWCETALSCEGSKITSIELVSICQMLRLIFENDVMIELSSCWRYRTSKSILKGALDIGFYLQVADSKEEAEEFERFISEEETHHLKKQNTLIGRTLKKIEFIEDGVTLELSVKRYLEWFCLSSDGLGFRAIDKFSQR